jgi:hypothetical protein
MPTYCKADFDRIAAAIDKTVDHVLRYESRFEAAATWYRLNAAAPQGKGPTPTMTIRSARQIANAARKLLRHLEVYDYRKAPDGPLRDAKRRELADVRRKLDGSSRPLPRACAHQAFSSDSMNLRLGGARSRKA